MNVMGYWVGGVLCATVSQSVLGQGYPLKPVRVIVGTAAGGGVDAISRIVASKLGERWPQPIVVENRAGAGGAVASEFVAKVGPRLLGHIAHVIGRVAQGRRWPRLVGVGAAFLHGPLDLFDGQGQRLTSSHEDCILWI